MNSGAPAPEGRAEISGGVVSRVAPGGRHRDRNASLNGLRYLTVGSLRCKVGGGRHPRARPDRRNPSERARRGLSGIARTVAEYGDGLAAAGCSRPPVPATRSASSSIGREAIGADSSARARYSKTKWYTRMARAAGYAQGGRPVPDELSSRSRDRRCFTNLARAGALPGPVGDLLGIGTFASRPRSAEGKRLVGLIHAAGFTAVVERRGPEALSGWRVGGVSYGTLLAARVLWGNWNARRKRDD